MFLATENRIVTVKRRDQICIFAEILEVAKNGALKTRIMYKANLSYVQLGIYLSFLSKANLIAEINQGTKAIYRTTEKGLGFLNHYYKIWEILYA